MTQKISILKFWMESTRGDLNETATCMCCKGLKGLFSGQQGLKLSGHLGYNFKQLKMEERVYNDSKGPCLGNAI